MLPSLLIEPPQGDAWIHEIKFDGYRTMLVIDGGEARAFTRNRFDWSHYYPTNRRGRREIAVPLGRD
jgi:bifunctional non-homologous end joining protein LigD